MRRFTVSIPEELKDKLDEMPDINWAEVARQGVVERLHKIAELDARGEL